MGIECLAIITARGGSKRIPKKNIREFCGKPIIAYSIDAALSSGLFDEVMVSTDSEEIADIAKKYGAKIPFMRSAETASDYATTNDVLNEVFSKYIEMGEQIKTACCIYPTAPFVTAQSLTDAHDILVNGNGRMVKPVVQFSFPPLRGIKINENGMEEAMFPEYMPMRSQDLPAMYHDCGQYYWFDVPYFVEHNGNMNGVCALKIVDELHVQDIDNETDWEIAEMKYEILKNKGLL